MKIVQVLLYLAAVLLLVLAASGRVNTRVGLVPLAGACALLAFALPVVLSL